MKSNTPYKGPVPEQTDLESIQETVDYIDQNFYNETIKMTCARRIALGTKLRNINSEVFGELTPEQRSTVMDFHRKTRPLVPFMMQQRAHDLSRNKPTYLSFNTLLTLAEHHIQQESEAAFK